MNLGLIRMTTPLVVTALLVACSGPTPTSDSGTMADAVDAPVESDAGAPPEGLPVDAVTEEKDVSAPSPEPTAEPSATPISEPISAITTTVTYVDPEIQYAIDYPESWTIDDVPGSIVKLMSFDPVERGSGVVQPDDLQIDIVPDLPQVEGNLEELVGLTTQASHVIDREELELEGGVPAVRLHLGTPTTMTGETLVLLTVINGRGIRVQGIGDLALFDPIARSLRPAE